VHKLSVFAILAVIVGTLSSPAAATKVSPFSNQLSVQEKSCLAELIKSSHWQYSPQSRAQMPAIAQVATTQLSDAREAYIFIFEADGWCGTAGCPLLIGELERDGTCRMLYDDMGDASFTVLRRSDHGYRRLYTPCEARFDGHQYQAVHEDCPNADVRH
jgi:hypothetical protein